MRGGGVGFYIKSEMKYRDRKYIEALDNSIEHQWIELNPKNNPLNHTLMGILYQPSSILNEKRIWLDKFESLLSQVTLIHHAPIIITGDFNIDRRKESPERKE